MQNSFNWEKKSKNNLILCLNPYLSPGICGVIKTFCDSTEAQYGSDRSSSRRGEERNMWQTRGKRLWETGERLVVLISLFLRRETFYLWGFWICCLSYTTGNLVEYSQFLQGILSLDNQKPSTWNPWLTKAKGNKSVITTESSSICSWFQNSR